MAQSHMESGFCQKQNSQHQDKLEQLPGRVCAAWGSSVFLFREKADALSRSRFGAGEQQSGDPKGPPANQQRKKIVEQKTRP